MSAKAGTKIPLLVVLSLPVVGLFALATVLLGRSVSSPGSIPSSWFWLGLALLAGTTGINLAVYSWVVRREEIRQRSHDDYSHLFHAIPAAMVLQSLLDGVLLDVNSAFCQMTGYTPPEVKGKTDLDLKLWVNPDAIANLRQSLVNGKRPNNQELCFRPKEGEDRYGLVSASNVTMNGQACALLLIQDITDQKQLELALKADEKRYRGIFENAVQGIFQSTVEGQYITVNQALANIYGYDSPTDLLTSVTDIAKQIHVQPKRREEFVAYMQLFNEVSDFESQVYRKDGSMIWISENVRAVKDEHGKLLYFEGTAQDVTERREMEEELRQQRLRAERLLLNILPQTIAERLKRGQLTIASRFDQVTVMFADLVDFTALSARIPAIELVKLLGLVFSEFDRLVAKYHLEKIKTIGDAYMVAGGLPISGADHASKIADMALEMQAAIAHIRSDTGEPFQLRIGINSGAIVAGVIGTTKFSYDLWGDTVNVASRMESQGLPGKIQVTQTTYELLKQDYTFAERGDIFVKGKGEMTTYWLVGKKAIDVQSESSL